MNAQRERVVTAAELDSLDGVEVGDGYHDGFRGDPEPGDNRSKAYWHGWINGRNDRERWSDAEQAALIRDIKLARRRAT